MRTALLLLALAATPAHAFLEDTYLIELSQGGLLTDKASQLRDNAGYESQSGDKITFDKWYSHKWTDARIAFLTKLDNSFGIIWGFSTGEKGQKYAIAPSAKVGFIYLEQLTKNSSLSIKATYTIGGKLKEKACTADYGDVGGVQQVNCRLAASMLAPADTLPYLLNEHPRDYKTVMIQYNWQF